MSWSSHHSYITLELSHHRITMEVIYITACGAYHSLYRITVCSSISHFIVQYITFSWFLCPKMADGVKNYCRPKGLPVHFLTVFPAKYVSIEGDNRPPWDGPRANPKVWPFAWFGSKPSINQCLPSQSLPVPTVYVECMPRRERSNL